MGSLQEEQPSEIILRAYDRLLEHRIIEITKSLYRGSNSHRSWTFECIARVPQPNVENIPEVVELRVVVPEEFPYAPVDVYSDHEEVQGFPHQVAATGRLCLRDETLAPRDERRLATYLSWSVAWLQDAANGTLLRSGDPYELPDFSLGSVGRDSLSTGPLLFEEDEKAYGGWRKRLGYTGRVTLVPGTRVPGLFAREFRDRSGELIHVSDWSPTVIGSGTMLEGRWLLVPDIRYVRHRPPNSYEELESLCSDLGLCLSKILKDAWEIDNRALNVGILLVGFPIPELVSGQCREIHWQPLVFRNKRHQHKNAPRGERKKRKGRGWGSQLAPGGQFASGARLPWGSSENCSSERMFSRGALPTSLRYKSVALLGCGAVGSSVAESLVRGGVAKIALYDPEYLEMGNLCRHTLDGRRLHGSKAHSLAERLSTVNPLAKIKSYSEGGPLNRRDSEAWRELKKADLIVDCTADQTAFEWLAHTSEKLNKPMCSLFINSFSSLLTFCYSGDNANCAQVFQRSMSQIGSGEADITAEEYFAEPAFGELVRDAGCWNPTFPARGNHISLLASFATDLVADAATKLPRASTVILRRRELDGAGGEAGVEVAWREDAA